LATIAVKYKLVEQTEISEEVQDRGRWSVATMNEPTESQS
jgi:hypothetical protein